MLILRMAIIIIILIVIIMLGMLKVIGWSLFQGAESKMHQRGGRMEGAIVEGGGGQGVGEVEEEQEGGDPDRGAGA